MKPALQARMEDPKSNSLNARTGRTANKSSDEVHLLHALKQITDPTMRYAVSMLVDCLAADLDPEDRKLGLQTYFALICKQIES